MKESFKVILFLLFLAGVAFGAAKLVVYAQEKKQYTITEVEQDVWKVNGIRDAMNLQTIYGNPNPTKVDTLTTNFTQDVFKTARDRIWDKRGSHPTNTALGGLGKDCSLWAIWYQRPDGDLIEDYNSNSHYILVVSRYGPINYQEGANYIEDINGTTYYRFSIALRLSD